MKPYLLALILFSCSKQVEKPIEPEPISFTQKRVMYSNKGNYEGTLVVIHYHRVDDPALIKQYKSLPAMQPFCDDLNDTLVTVLGKPCPADCGLK